MWRVKQTTASNLALVLVAIAWALVCYGALSQMGDYAPATPRAVIEANRHRSTLIWLFGLLCLIGSLWLSGYGFAAAKVRSVLAAVACVAPLLVVVFALWR